MKREVPRLAGKAGIVVGAGQSAGDTVGNGRAAAIIFARAGARLLLVDRSLAAARETAQLIASEGGQAQAFEADWTDPRACQAFAAGCIALWDRIDFLHNSIGILGTERDPAAPSIADFERVLRSNLTGCLHACQAVLPLMRQQGVGSIVNVSSIAAVVATGLLAYSISKAAMNAL